MPHQRYADMNYGRMYCIVLPKFHCDIEFYWGAVKKYLCDNCDCTFEHFEGELAESIEVCAVTTIRRWEYRMYQWMNA